MTSSCSFSNRMSNCPQPCFKPLDMSKILCMPAPVNGWTLIRSKPFVVVLVDGDAYHWSNETFSKARESGSNVTAGSLAAQQLRRQVQAYILGNPRIPPSCEIIARVFCNAAGRPGPLGHRGRGGLLREFMVDFTRDIPLFDFFDSGSGKEQADTKIRGTVLFMQRCSLGSPLIQRVFALFRPYETNRGIVNFELFVSESALPCSLPCRLYRQRLCKNASALSA